MAEVAGLTGCGDLLDRCYLHLSGGEQQRVQLARVLAQLWRDGEPQGFLFLDEPTSALDLYHQQHILRLLHRLTRQGKLMVCTVLHDLNQASLWADRIILLHRGSLVAQGIPQQVLNTETLQHWYGAELIVHTATPTNGHRSCCYPETLGFTPGEPVMTKILGGICRVLGGNEKRVRAWCQ